MFSGIVEEAALVTSAVKADGNLTLRVKSAFANELKIDQSVAHNGVCLTVVEIFPDSTYSVVAIQETLDRSNLGDLKAGSLVNLERSMIMNGRLDGHIVQGHVDCTATCVEVEEVEGSRYYKFSYQIDPSMIRKGYMTVEKGSVCVNGVSLTVCDSEPTTFRVAIIPYTFEHTNFKEIEVGTRVNIEFDIIGKYIARMQELA